MNLIILVPIQILFLQMSQGIHFILFTTVSCTVSSIRENRWKIECLILPTENKKRILLSPFSLSISWSTQVVSLSQRSWPRTTQPKQIQMQTKYSFFFSPPISENICSNAALSFNPSKHSWSSTLWLLHLIF